MSESIDRFIPGPDVAERHETLVYAPADLVFAVAEQFDLQSLGTVRAIFWLRSKFMRASSASLPRLRLGELLSLGWGVLARTPGRELVAGATAQPWLADVVFHPLPPERFAAFAEPDQVKIVWTLEAEPLAPALTRFRTQTRAKATDAAARAKFRRYWMLARFGIVAIRLLVVPAIRRESERRYRAMR